MTLVLIIIPRFSGIFTFSRVSRLFHFFGYDELLFSQKNSQPFFFIFRLKKKNPKSKKSVEKKTRFINRFIEIGYDFGFATPLQSRDRIDPNHTPGFITCSYDLKMFQNIYFIGKSVMLNMPF